MAPESMLCNPPPNIYSLQIHAYWWRVGGQGVRKYKQGFLKKKERSITHNPTIELLTTNNICYTS